MKIKKKILYLVLVFLLSCTVFAFIYLHDYYHADTEAIAAFALDACNTETLNDSVTVYIPENAKAGFIFYPGGKVEHGAYEPLMQACAERGILCVLVEMPFNLAVLDMDAAEGIQEEFPEIENWYIGGHSLGGSMAASYLADNYDNYNGLILLGSYSTANLSRIDLDVLSIYGSKDGVLNREKYKECRINLPADFTELVIDGGNHAGFGMYGKQDGDGEAGITNEEQISVTAESIAAFVLK